MHLNSRGDWCAGIGGTTASVKGKIIATPAGGTTWPDDDHVVYQVCETVRAPKLKSAITFADYRRQMLELHSFKRSQPPLHLRRTAEACRVERYNIHTGVKDVFRPHGANFIEASGGTGAVWLGTSDPNAVGLTIVDALAKPPAIKHRFPNSGIGPVGPDGAASFKVNYQSWGPWDVIERDGTRWQLTPNDALQINLLGQGRAVWLDTVGIRAKGVPTPTLLPGILWWLKVIKIDNDWWALYQTGDGRLLFHPFDSFNGYPIAPVGSMTYRPDLCLLPNGKVRIVWATREDEGPDVQVVIDFDMTTSRQPLSPAPPPPPPPPPSPEKKVIRNCSAYLKQRWNELGIPQKMAEITERMQVTPKERKALVALSKMRREVDAGKRRSIPRLSKRTTALEEAYKAVQCPAFFQIIGELHHDKKFRDVGLSVKTGGNNWLGYATDIMAIKPTNASGAIIPGNFHLIDALTGVGSANTKPQWLDHGENPHTNRPWAAPPVPGGGDVEPGETHRYIGGGNDTGKCDSCGRPKLDPVHLVPEGLVPHEPWLGEDNKGDCDLCFQPVDAIIHRADSVERHVYQPARSGTGPCLKCGQPADNLAFHFEPEEPPLDKHLFVGTGTFCSECGKRGSDPIHDLTPPDNGGGVDTDRIVAAIEKASAAEVAAIDRLRADVVSAVKEFGKGLPDIFGGLLGKPVKKPSRKR